MRTVIRIILIYHHAGFPGALIHSLCFYNLLDNNGFFVVGEGFHRVIFYIRILYPDVRA